MNPAPDAAPLRILHVIASVGPSHGGPSVMVHEMAAGLVEAGHRAEVATTDEDAGRRLPVPLRTPVERDGATYRYFPRQLRFATLSLPLAHWVRGAVTRFDVVHVHGLFSHPTAAAARAARAAGVPFIIRPLGALQPWGMSQGRRHLKRWTLRLVDGPLLAAAAAVHYTSAEERDGAIAAGARGRAVVLPLGIHLPPPAEGAGHAWITAHHPDWVGRTVVLFLSRLHAKKGLDVLLPAFAAARRHHPAACLLLAGDGDPAYAAKLRAAIDHHGLGEHVRFAGRLEGADKAAVLEAAELFVLPSHGENFGVAVVEALAAGCPAVLSTAVPLSEAVVRGGAGWAASPEVTPFAAALEVALGTEAEERRAMGERGRALVAARWSRGRMVEELVELYRAVARPHPAEGAA